MHHTHIASSGLAAWEEQGFSQSIHVQGRQPLHIIREMPTKKSAGNPIVYVPGWGAPPEAIQPMVAALASLGKVAFALNEPHANHGTGTKDRMILKMIDALDPEVHTRKIDFICHSEGAIHCLRAVLQHPERFGTVMLMNPAGSLRKESLLGLMTRVVGDFFQNIAHCTCTHVGRKRHKEKARLKHLLALFIGQQRIVPLHPIASFSEVEEMAHVHIASLLRRLRILRSSGRYTPQIALLWSEGDHAFPLEESELTPSHYDSLTILPGKHERHTTPLQRPMKYMKAAVRIIEESKHRR